MLGISTAGWLVCLGPQDASSSIPAALTATKRRSLAVRAERAKIGSG
jgi:hypothetical protein